MLSIKTWCKSELRAFLSPSNRIKAVLSVEGKLAVSVSKHRAVCTHMMLRDVLSVPFPVKITNDRDLFFPLQELSIFNAD
jgi:hypothetical protein